jgi:recombination protein RecT
MSTQAPEKPSTTDLAKPAERPVGIIAQVSSQIETFNKGQLSFPTDFNMPNALASAKVALVTLSVIDVNGKPTQACTEVSLVNALFDSLVQGLNVGKKQGYFINYGKVLTFQRSYFGDLALACRVKPNLDPYYEVIYKGEEFEIEKVRVRGAFRTLIVKHKQKFPRESTEIIGAYCGAADKETGEDLGIELMTIEQIKTSWKKSKAQGPNSFHNEQPDQACLRTVIRRWSKPIINSSNDICLLEAINRQADDSVEAEFNEEVDEHANKETLALDARAPVAAEEQKVEGTKTTTVTPQSELDI